MYNVDLQAQGQSILHVEFIPTADLVDGLYYPTVEEHSNGVFARKLRYVIGFEDAPTAQTFANTFAHDARDQYETTVKSFING